MFERLVNPATEVVRAALRPETMPGHVRELTSIGVTAALWPLGLADKGIAELRRRVTGDESPIETPVLLVHGYGANKSNWLYLERYLRDAGFRRVHALNYNPLTADIPALGAACTRRARELMDHFGVDRIHVIGHSLGGVVARYAVQISGLEGVDTLVTVASPHRGAPLARIGFGATAAQLCPGSPVLRRLRASSRPLPTTFVAYYSNLDLIVPARRAMILEPALRATNVLVKDEGHLSILLSRRLAASVVDQLGAAEGLPGYGTRLAPLVPAAPVAGTGDASVAAAG